MKRDIVIIVVSLLAGFLGGTASSIVKKPDQQGIRFSQGRIDAEVISAKNILLLDEKLQPRIMMNQRGIKLYNSSGKETLSLFSGEEGTGLHIFDRNGIERYDLRLSQDERWMLARMTDIDGNKRVFFGIGDDGKPGLIFSDQTDKVIWFAPENLAGGSQESN